MIRVTYLDNRQAARYDSGPNRYLVPGRNSYYEAHMRLSLSRSAVLFQLFLLAGGPLAGCQPSADKSKGTLPRGPEKTETRVVGPFQGVVAEGRVEIVVKPGATKDAELKGPSNYLDYLTLRTETRELAGQQIPVLVAALNKGIK